MFKKPHVHGSRIRPDWTWDKEELEKLPQGYCPWCRRHPKYPWSTLGTSHRNVKRAVRKGRARIIKQRTWNNNYKTRVICNHECHQTEDT